MESEEAQAPRAEGLDPDDPAVRDGIDLVRWELSLYAPAEGPAGCSSSPMVNGKERNR
ncbi:MAG: hypothetical protein JOY55_08445 [Mycobacterium sp.]|nr:hypothetical protein [Mycobacterium sp.]MBV8291834.1 hypothetical protein [Mycobacterium sp.]